MLEKMLSVISRLELTSNVGLRVSIATIRFQLMLSALPSSASAGEYGN